MAVTHAYTHDTAETCALHTSLSCTTRIPILHYTHPYPALHTSPSCTTRIPIPPGAITAIGIMSPIQSSTNSILVVTGSSTGQIATWQANTVSTTSGDRASWLLSLVSVSQSHTSAVCGVVTGCFGSPVMVATAAADSTVSLWELETGWL